MPWVSGPTRVCMSCSSPNLRLVNEHLDRDGLVYVASVECLECHCSMLDSRRPSQLRPYTEKGPIDMAKTKKRKPVNSHAAGRDGYPKKRSPRSEVLPGLEHVRSKPLDNICEAIGDCRQQMNTAATEEERLRSNALQHMQKKNITVHRHAGVELVRVPGGGEKLRVRLTKEEGDASVDTGVETSSDVEPDEEPAAAVEAGDELRPGVHAEH